MILYFPFIIETKLFFGTLRGVTDLELEHLLNSLPKDLYTNSLLSFEPSIEFHFISDNFSEVTFSLTSQKLIICSFHPIIYKMSFFLRKVQEACMEDHSAALIIPWALSPTTTMESEMSLSNLWDLSMSLEENLHTPPPQC